MKRHRHHHLKPTGSHSWPVPQYLLPPEWSALHVDGELPTAAQAAAHATTTDGTRGPSDSQLSSAA